MNKNSEKISLKNIVYAVASFLLAGLVVWNSYTTNNNEKKALNNETKIFELKEKIAKSESENDDNDKRIIIMEKNNFGNGF